MGETRSVMAYCSALPVAVMYRTITIRYIQTGVELPITLSMAGSEEVRAERHAALVVYFQEAPPVYCGGALPEL